MMQADKNRLYKDVEILSSITPPRNYANINSLDAAAAHIYNELKMLGLETEYQYFTAGGKKYKNVTASYQPEKTKRIVIGAHYDVCGDQPGADDNASGVAGLLETARMMLAQKPHLDYRVDFVGYCLEEPPFFATNEMGSYAHAKSLYESKIEVEAMFCYEMIGYFSDEPNSQNFPDPMLAQIYPHTGNYIIVVGRTGAEDFTLKVRDLMRTNAKIGVEAINLPENTYLAGLSDHRNYWKFGYEAVMIDDTSFLRNPNYHTKGDTIDTLDFDKMAEVVNGVYRAILKLYATASTIK